MKSQNSNIAGEAYIKELTILVGDFVAMYVSDVVAMFIPLRCVILYTKRWPSDKFKENCETNLRKSTALCSYH